MPFNPDHARRISALEGSSRVVQVGVQSVSGKAITRAREFSTPERLGTITAVHAHHLSQQTIRRMEKDNSG
jgi:hypothetical protein